MRVDDLRTLAYLAFSALGEKCDGMTPDSTRDLFTQARVAGLLDFEGRPDGSILVKPLPSKPATQVAGVQGIDAGRNMGDRS